jgi:putative oxidoreductase
MFLKALFRPADRPPAAFWSDVAGLLLRAALGGVFIYHGLVKILGEGSEWGANWLSVLLGAPNLYAEPTPFLTAVQLTVAWGELLGGVALGVGLLTRLAACVMILIQILAAYFAIAYQSFSMTKGGGAEYNLVLLAMCAAVLILGGGRFSVDCLLLRGRREGQEATPAPSLAASDLVSTARG